MSAAALDRLLAVLLAAILASGLFTLRAGSLATGPLFVVHGVLAGSLAVAVGLKVARSLPRAVRARRWQSVAVSLVLGLAVAVSIVAGFAWVVTGRLLVIGPWTVLTLHVLVGLAAVPIVVAHPPSSLASASSCRGCRRRLVGLAADGDRDGRAGGCRRRGVAGGERNRARDGRDAAIHRLSLAARWRHPATFFGEQGPALDAESWRLRVDGAVARPLSLSLGELAGLGQETRTEVLDCTSGWALRTAWRGTPLSALLARAQPEPGARHVTVRSATGWYARLSVDEADDALLATEVAGRLLPAENGAPCRLVIRDRRGLEWVKWVSSVTVD